jgi:hypothetical protein
VPCYCMAVFYIRQFGSIFLHSVFPSILWLSSGSYSSKILSRIHFGILLLNTLTTFPAHCSLLTRICITRLLSLCSLHSLLSLSYDIRMLFSLFLTYFLVFCVLNHLSSHCVVRLVVDLVVFICNSTRWRSIKELNMMPFLICMWSTIYCKSLVLKGI